MCNENKNVSATIQLDKLIFSCSSTVDDNFNEAIKYHKSMTFTEQVFGETTLTPAGDLSHRYKYSYTVCHAGNKMGQIDFCLFGQSWADDRIRFSVDNAVFYNNTFHLLPQLLENLFLQVESFTSIEIAIDNYTLSLEQIIRRGLKSKENSVILLRKKVKDRNKLLKEVIYYNCGTLNNPFKYRTLYIKNKKKTFGIKAYNKREEIASVSKHKNYILDYHQQHNPNYHNIFRLEVNLAYEELRRYQKKHGDITLNNLLDKGFLHSLLKEYFDKLLVIRDSKGQKIEFVPNPIPNTSEGM